VSAVVVPVLTLIGRDGRIDRGACAAYAQRAAESWLDGFLVSGSLGLGPTMSAASRLDSLAIWREHMPAGRLLGCAWDAAEVAEVYQLGVRPVAVLRCAEDDHAVLGQLEGLPGQAWVYSHPQYSPAVLSSGVVEKARAAGVLPAGAKVSKVGPGEVRSLRDAAGPSFALFDGRCRHVRASVAAGATGVVAVPLATLPEDLPPRDDLDGLQAVIDRGQRVVDAFPDVVNQVAALREILAL
jgi:dihydrodipicolinate synthase/N-acetylneuraminate lyase